VRFCDVTLSYTATSGGIRTYLDAKRDYLERHTDHEHVLIVPGEHDRVEKQGRRLTYTIGSPLLPGCEPYRFFWRPDKIRGVLEESKPDAIELGSVYVAPWPALAYRDEQVESGRPVVVGAYFHSDIADAYFGGPIRDAFVGWSDLAEWVADRMAGVAELGAESYVGSIFERANVRLAASTDQADRLRDYGVEGHVDVVPLGVNIERFHPDRRSDQRRRDLGAEPDDLVLVFAGRLDAEKRPDFLVEAFERLPSELKARLVLVGEGPMKESLNKRAGENDRLHVLPYESDPDRFAELIASADLYVTAGAHETFGLSVVEAQACGLPVVGVEAGALVERVPEGLGRLGPVHDAEAFAANIEAVAAERDAMGRAARRHVEENFSWRACFQRWLEIYEAAMASAKSL